MSERNWLRLACMPGIGASRAARLLAHYGDPAAALAGSAADWKALGLPDKIARQRDTADPTLLEQTQAWLAEPANALVTADHPHASPQLRMLEAPPAWLYAVGDT